MSAAESFHDAPAVVGQLACHAARNRAGGCHCTEGSVDWHRTEWEARDPLGSVFAPGRLVRQVCGDSAKLSRRNGRRVPGHQPIREVVPVGRRAYAIKSCVSFGLVGIANRRVPHSVPVIREGGGRSVAPTLGTQVAPWPAGSRTARATCRCGWSIGTRVRRTPCRSIKGDGPIKTFTLRGIKDSPPYNHDGRLLTLEDTVEFFNLVLQLRLDAEEKEALTAFMRCL